MEFAEIFEEFKYNKVIIVDDDLALLNEDSVLNDVITSNPTFENYVLTNNVDVNSTMGEVKVTNEYVFNLIKESCGVSLLYDFVKKIESNINVLIYKEFSTNIIGNCTDEDNVIWIVDKKLDDTVDLNHIISLFNKFIENRKNGKNDIFIVYSSDTTNFNTYNKVKAFLEEKVELTFAKNNSLYFNVVDKENVLTCDILLDLMIKANEAEYFNNINKSIDTSLENLKNEMWRNNDFKSLYCYDYLSEGLTLENNLFGIIFNNVEYYCRLSKSSNIEQVLKMNNTFDYKFYNKLTDDIRKISQLGSIMKKINRYLCVDEIDDTVNTLKHEIAFGDIIKIDQNYYLIVSQQCDLTIRSNGKRNLERIKLLPIRFTKISNEFYVESVINDISRIYSNTKPVITDDVLQSGMDYFNESFFGITGKNYSIEDVKKEYTEIDSYFLKYNDEYYTISYKQKSYEKNMKSYFLDILSQNSAGQLIFNQSGLNKTGCMRYPIKMTLERAFKDLRNQVINNSDMDNDVIKTLRLIYDLKCVLEKKHYKVSLWRVGRINEELAKKIYTIAIANETREANMIYVRTS